MSDPRVIVLRADGLTHAGFAPFGVLPSDEGDEHDTADLEFLLGDGHVNFIGHAADEVPRGPDGLRCELLNRHDTHTQTLLPIDGDAVIVVAPAALDFSSPEHLDAIRAFVVPEHTAVHLHRGTWHWGPYPLTARSVRIFNVQGRGYRDDNAVAWLARDLQTVVEVDPAAEGPRP